MQKWLEMHDLRSKRLSKSVWIPLLAYQTITEEGKYGYAGYKEDYFAIGSLAVPLDSKDKALALEWMDVGGRNIGKGYVEDGEYTPIDIYKGFKNDITAVNLVLAQYINGEVPKKWYLHQDFVITLGLLREKDTWVSPNEGYMEVARLSRNKYGEPCLLEVRAEHLKDYLAARNMGLYTTSYWSRRIVINDTISIKWEDNNIEEKSDDFQWKGSILAINEGRGTPYGSTAAIFHVARTDVAEGEDIPDISGSPTNENITSSSWEKKFEGEKLFSIDGQMWKNEWIEPANVSPRVREDELAPTIYFIVNEQGTKENKDTLKEGGKWLWFKPDVIMSLAHMRGGSLSWYTKDTGNVKCSPDYRIHFGVNSLGLINVYAKDIALLPEWQQQIWVGNNVSPEGGVSDELLASQVKAVPASTKAPEAFFYEGIKELNAVAKDVLSITLFREHEFIPKLMKNIHRFRAIDQEGLYALAKDIARVTADSIDASEIQKIILSEKDKKLGSIKSLEHLLALKIKKEDARMITAPLVGVYELRLADAHLPKSQIDDAFNLLKIDQTQLYIFQAQQMLHSSVTSIFTIIDILKQWNEDL